MIDMLLLAVASFAVGALVGTLVALCQVRRKQKEFIK